jgi:hypothetical protein
VVAGETTEGEVKSVPSVEVADSRSTRAAAFWLLQS